VESNIIAVARGTTKNGDSHCMNALPNSLSKPMDSLANKSMDKLQKQAEELNRKKMGNKMAFYNLFTPFQ